MGNRFDGYITVTVGGGVIATSAASAQTAIPNCSSGEKPRYVRVAASAPACIRMGKTSVTASNVDTQIQPGDATIFSVPLGYDVIAAIQVSGPGAVQISPLENL